MLATLKAAAVGAVLSTAVGALHAQAVDLNSIPPYKKELNVVGGVRLAGSELKGVVDKLVAGFMKFQPDARMSTNFMTSRAVNGFVSDASRNWDCTPIGVCFSILPQP